MTPLKTVNLITLGSGSIPQLPKLAGPMELVHFNPFVPTVAKTQQLVKISIFFIGVITGPGTYELREFETIVGEPHL